MSRPKIHYSQCWEDPRPSLETLELKPEDDVLSIASGGDNSFALLLGRPQTLTIVDRNPAQLYLVELKMRALEHLSYEELLGFVGVKASPDRERTYAGLRPSLAESARNFWDERRNIVREGLIFAGKFERFIGILRRFILPWIHRSGTTRAFLSCSAIQEQAEFYEKTWANRRWRMLFRHVFGKHVFGRLGRDPSFYRYVTIADTGDHFYRRLPRTLTELPIRENPTWIFFLAGRYLWPESYPLWLQKDHLPIIKAGLSRIRLKHGFLHDVLAAAEPGAFSKFNLSNIFEYMSEDLFEITLREILKTSRPGAKIAFWTLFVPRPIPKSMGGRIVSDPALEGRAPVFSPRFPSEDFWLWRIP